MLKMCLSEEVLEEKSMGETARIGKEPDISIVETRGERIWRKL